jgi:hypothetical protein
VHAQWREIGQDQSSSPVEDRKNVAPAKLATASAPVWDEDEWTDEVLE